MKPLSSGFAMLDVKDGRDELLEHFQRDGNPNAPCAEDLRIPVVIRGYIDGVCGSNDGISTEYAVMVTDMQTGPSTSADA